MSTETINPLPTAGSDFLEVLRTFLSDEDAQRFALIFHDFFLIGGIHGTVAGLTATPDALTAFPGGFLVTETGSITYPDNSTVFVIASAQDTGDLGPYLRVAGTHYLIVAAVSAPALPTTTVIRLMTVTTSGGAITNVVDTRELSPFRNKADIPYYRLIGTEASAVDMRLSEHTGAFVIDVNTDTENEPTWEHRFSFLPSNFLLALVSGVTAFRTQTFPDKDGTFAMLSDITSGVFAAGTRMLFDNDAAPTGWTRVVTIDDKVPLIVAGARSDSGSWTISGLTVSAGNHRHELPMRLDGTVPERVPSASWAPGNTTNNRTTAFSNAAAAASSGFTVWSGAPDTVSAQAISSDASWRPAYRAIILCSKD